jgi:acetyl-CoA acetyltransferase
MDGSFSGSTAIAGIGETAYYRRGGSPDAEFKMALQATLAAAADAGLDVRAIDGFSSFSGDRNDGSRLATALDLPDLRYSATVGVSGHAAAAIANAAAAVAAGYADYVVAFRSLAQGQFGRFGQFGGYGGGGGEVDTVSFPGSLSVPYGVFAPVQTYSLRTTRFMHDHGIGQEALRAISLACYHHAQRNPRAVMFGRPLTAPDYDDSRWIVEPQHLFDCCMENDCAAAVIVTTTERARDLRHGPAVILGVATGADRRQFPTAQGGPDFATANMKTVAARVFAMAGLTPADVDVAQLYDNFTGAVLMSIVEHGFCTPDEVNEFVTFENLTWPNGKLPINTSGGNVAEAYVHGIGLVLEAVRQLRGTSTSQVEGAEVALATAAPLAWATGSLLLGRG